MYVCVKEEEGLWVTVEAGRYVATLLRHDDCDERNVCLAQNLEAGGVGTAMREKAADDKDKEKNQQIAAPLKKVDDHVIQLQHCPQRRRSQSQLVGEWKRFCRGTGERGQQTMRSALTHHTARVRRASGGCGASIEYSSPR